MHHNAHDPHLFRTAQGHVLRCACCGRVQIVFCEYTLLVDEKDFRIIRKTVARAWEELEDGTGGEVRLLAATDAGEVSTTLRPQEIAALHRLLNGAQAMLTLEQRLRDIEAGLYDHDVTA